ncbi:zinc ribbon domain-containing protein [Corallococcus praedator]|uniref:Zinc ribbon domain-containing protein n=1 Tax=Corallococcus praedator TaxID=2316724 RepID=A0ABX9Q6X8_9BACT|nr:MULTISPECIES: zinc ribbon domain-containing protein [Corallococcus]RKG97711.1 zinc ribbon domain-containing protein [Corallococcus sp. CA047B]RKH34453.1 zinc ribbon domain-containing protein [Corallococcus sp. CA031C]RKH90070.1 zinc ribbon domain-containing protein [Corallococcus praedator]
MPIYEYGCSACGKTIDVLQKMSDPAPAACTACGAGGTLTKQVSRSSFHLKGGGWYSDLYGSTKKDGGGGSSSSSSSSSSAAPAAASAPASSAPAASPAPAPSSSAGGDKS